MNYILFDHEREYLLPLTFTRPVCDIRIGILTIRDKWERFLDSTTSTKTENYLSVKFPLWEENDNILVNGGVCPDIKLVSAILKLQLGQSLVKNGRLIASRLVSPEEFKSNVSDGLEYEGEILSVEYPWDIFSKNGEALNNDFELLTVGRTSEPLSSSNTIIGDGKVFLEEGARSKPLFLTQLMAQFTLVRMRRLWRELSSEDRLPSVKVAK